MANLKDIGVSAAINILSAFAFLVAFAILRIQPVNDRVYFPKWYRKGVRSSPTHSGTFANKFVNLDLRTYLRFLNWMPDALKMPESELVDHAGLDSVAYLRIYLLGLVFCPAFSHLLYCAWTRCHFFFWTTRLCLCLVLLNWLIDVSTISYSWIK